MPPLSSGRAVFGMPKETIERGEVGGVPPLNRPTEAAAITRQLAILFVPPLARHRKRG